MTARDHAPLQRWSSILVGAAVLGLVGLMTLEQLDAPRRPAAAAAKDEGPAADAASPEPAAAASDHDGGAPAEGDGEDAGLSALSLDLGDAALPTGAPRAIKVGVVLVQWQGAEGATTSTRSKADALARATDLAREAKADFRRAVTQGDPGSAEDIGRIPRGTLDPRTEMAVFSMSAGDVSEPIETPRGYWIVRRID